MTPLPPGTTRLAHNHDGLHACSSDHCPAHPRFHGPVAATGAPPSASDALAGLSARSQALVDAEAAREAQHSLMAAELERWWYRRVDEEITGVVPKAVEYSSTDLIDLGRQIADVAGWSVEQKADEGALAELGIAFYVAGKVGRVMGAIKEGRRPSDDTWHDIAVYTKMAQRVREVGAWPGV